LADEDFAELLEAWKESAPRLQPSGPPLTPEAVEWIHKWMANVDGWQNPGWALGHPPEFFPYWAHSFPEPPLTRGVDTRTAEERVRQIREAMAKTYRTTDLTGDSEEKGAN
jgi:hypothetical protein